MMFLDVRLDFTKNISTYFQREDILHTVNFVTAVAWLLLITTISKNKVLKPWINRRDDKLESTRTVTHFSLIFLEGNIKKMVLLNPKSAYILKEQVIHFSNPWTGL